jgi:5-(carboxyamino)imidazole ribonucleotide mutase
MIAAKTTLPVLGVPVPSTPSARRRIRCLSIVQMPKGVPVATFAIGEAGCPDAALFGGHVARDRRPRAGRASLRGKARKRLRGGGARHDAAVPREVADCVTPTMCRAR